MKSNRGLRLALLACLTVSPTVHAALGGSAQSVQADQASMGATRNSAARTLNAVQGGYTVQTLILPSGTVVHEYLSNNGIVFAVTWQGPVMPDLKQILGSYMESAADAVKAYRMQYPGIGPVSATTDNFAIQAGGHMGAYVGRAYLPLVLLALPTGPVLSDIK
jgi:hypothetical protein